MQKSAILISVLLSLWLPKVQAADYSQMINDSGWAVETSVLECRMTHSVPFYGKAVFRRRAGESGAGFTFEGHSGRLLSGKALLTAEAPVWQPRLGTVQLGEAAIAQERVSIRLGDRRTQQLLAQLNQGREIVVEQDPEQAGAIDKDENPQRADPDPGQYHNAEHYRERESYANARSRPMTISSIAFRGAYQTYLGCLASLLPINFDQIKRTAVYFAPGQYEELPEGELEKLENILLYAQADPQLREFYIDGHTDSAGTREDNLKLSEERAKLISDYLIRRGLPEDRVITRWHGERYPAESNGTLDGRQQNRRVTIRLERVQTIEIPPLAALQNKGT